MSGHNDTDNGVPTEATTQTFVISNLPTASVTLYQTRAHIVRRIDNVLLRPGANQVVIYGLSPTVDEHSIQIEGTGGTATIADMTVELVPNREIFEETYPEESDDSDDESDSEYRDSDDEEGAVKEIAEELKVLNLQVSETTETKNSAVERLATLDRYAQSATAEHLNHQEVTQLNKTYEDERASIFKVHVAATSKLLELEKQIKRKENQKVRAGKEAKKREEKVAKQKAKDRRRRELQKEEKRKEAKYAKQERLRYWAKKVYKVTLLLESSSLDTPGSSRRNSLDTITLASSPRPDQKALKSTGVELSAPQAPISLLLSYVTKEAGWSPRYDIRISSLQKTATIIYRTEFLNRTSETWKDAKLSFSTSQTSYQGLDDVVPFMHAWRIKLARHVSGDGGLLSPEEAQMTRNGRPVVEAFDRADLFGLNDNFIPALQSKRPLEVQQVANPSDLLASTHGGTSGYYSKRSAPPRGGFGFATSSMSNRNMLASASVPDPPETSRVEEIQSNSMHANVEMAGAIHMAKAKRSVMRPSSSLFSSNRKKEQISVPGTYTVELEDDEEIASLTDVLDFEETSWEDNGLTATYDVPGVRTLIPSSMTRRHKIATLNASNVHLSHICVPKLRSAAFLRTKIRNPSSVTLLKGSAGVTLDGSFLGNMNLPRVSPGQVFELPLGVDPAIHINYPKPSVHRSTQGIIFNKESAQIFARSIWINNTKPHPVELLVIDQTPVSEDDRLRVAITTPKGLVKDGDSVKAGQSAKEGSSGALAVDDTKGNWGTALAKLKKNGEVNWTIKLEKAQGCLLKLEYEARLPPSEKIVPA